MPCAMPSLAFRPQLPSVSIAPPEPAGERPSCLAFSMTKAGSTLLFNILEAASARAGLAYFAIEDVLFSQGRVGRDRPARLDMAFSPTGLCYGGFRRFPAYRIPILDTTRAVWLVRDPRDMLVSLYFSKAYSHAAPGEPGSAASERFRASRERTRATDMEAFALDHVMQYACALEGYYAQGFPQRDTVRIYRYEDVVFDKRAWLADMADWFGWRLSSDDIEAAVGPNDVVPEAEDPARHIRRVRPGGYREHLSQRALHRIESVLGEFMRDFGYPFERPRR